MTEEVQDLSTDDAQSPDYADGADEQINEKQKAIEQIRIHRGVVFWSAITGAVVLFAIFLLVFFSFFRWLLNDAEAVKNFFASAPYSVAIISILLIVPAFILSSLAKSVYGSKDEEIIPTSAIIKFLMSGKTGQ